MWNLPNEIYISIFNECLLSVVIAYYTRRALINMGAVGGENRHPARQRLHRVGETKGALRGQGMVGAGNRINQILNPVGGI